MTPRAATSDQWLIQMERGLEDGYVRTYGEPPEKPIVDWNFNHDEIDETHFTRVWKSARLVLEARTRRLALTGSCDGCRQTSCSPVACASRREPRAGPLMRLFSGPCRFSSSSYSKSGRWFWSSPRSTATGFTVVIS
jgi:hypothetical protein